MKLDRPSGTGSPADSSSTGDAVSETGLNSHGRDSTPVPDSARNHRMSREGQFAGASTGLAGAADAPSGTRHPASGVTGDAGRDQQGAGQDGIADGTDSGGLHVQETPTGAEGDAPRDPPDNDGWKRDEPFRGEFDPAAGFWDYMLPARPESQAPDALDDGGDAGPDRERDRTVPDDGPEPAGDSRGDDQGSGDSGRRSRADAGEQARQAEGAAVREGDAQDQPAENQPESRDREAEPVRERSQGQEHRPEAQPDAGVEQTDEQRWAAMEQRMQSAMEQKLEAALDGIKADYESKLDEQKAEADSIKAEFEAKETRSEARISELESKLEATQRVLHDALDRGPDTGDQPEPAGSPDAAKLGERQDERDSADLDSADLNAEGRDIVGRIGETARPDPDVAGRTESDLAKAGREGLGVAGSLALVHPVFQMAMTTDTARRTYNDLSPEEKYKVNEMMGTFVTASGSMSPGAAVAAVTISAIIPTLRDKLHDAVGKIKRKD